MLNAISIMQIMCTTKAQEAIAYSQTCTISLGCLPNLRLTISLQAEILIGRTSQPQLWMRRGHSRSQ